MLLVVAIARPQKGLEQVHEVNKGIAIEMVVDRSSSMGAEMAFGGVYYLFLRGIDPLRPGEGIYFHQPGAGEIDGYEQKLAALLQGHGGEDH